MTIQRRRPPVVERTQRGYKLLTRYGIEENDYDALLARQGGRCAICDATEPGGQRRVFSVDHDHMTGLVRGLLCGNCNFALGHFKDRPDLLERAVEYLRDFVNNFAEMVETEERLPPH
jgi:hypothetical protein